eukprot:1136239-Pelagomonas_calceolata.AAC.3
MPSGIQKTGVPSVELGDASTYPPAVPYLLGGPRVALIVCARHSCGFGESGSNWIQSTEIMRMAFVANGTSGKGCNNQCCELLTNESL